MAKVHIRGPFGAIETVAAVSRGLPEGYPYLFSNSSESLLNDRGCTFADAQVMALTRSKARVLAQQLRYGEGEGAKAKELTTESEEVKPDEALIPIPPTENPENGDPTVGHPRVESFGGGGVCCVPLPVTSSRRARCRRHSVPRTQRLLRLTIVSRDGALAPRLGPAECGGGFGERKIRRCFLEGWVHPEQLSIELRGSRVPGGRFTPLIPPSYCGPPLPFVKWTDGPR
ncbi:hypothetical protein HPB51_014422 [Rhipicephalus microplus]|uniref:Uncharacterized protein n=1 Tax=Rhipicephalus microplus TaxID=6941 RepID=A0A9J6F389_RHIMP|nr:hypothetical protein HPB51_014422 [Rhipicephalus microplus]